MIILFVSQLFGYASSMKSKLARARLTLLVKVAWTLNWSFLFQSLIWSARKMILFISNFFFRVDKFNEIKISSVTYTPLTLSHKKGQLWTLKRPWAAISDFSELIYPNTVAYIWNKKWFCLFQHFFWLRYDKFNEIKISSVKRPRPTRYNRADNWANLEWWFHAASVSNCSILKTFNEYFAVNPSTNIHHHHHQF